MLCGLVLGWRRELRGAARGRMRMWRPIFAATRGPGKCQRDGGKDLSSLTVVVVLIVSASGGRPLPP